MIGRAAERFIRTTWASVQELAEELYATFSKDLPIQASRVIINQAEGDQSTPITINRGGTAEGPTITINRGDGGSVNYGGIDIHGNQYGDTNFDFGGFGGTNTYGLPGGSGSRLDIGFFPPGGGIDEFGSGDSGSGGSGGGVDLSGIYFPNQEFGSVPIPQDNPILLYGEVVGKESGRNYSVNVWAKTPEGPRIGTLVVRFPMLDPSEEMPEGTHVPVLCFPGYSGLSRVIVDAVGWIPVYLAD